MDLTPDVSDFNYEEEEGGEDDYGDNDDDDERMLLLPSFGFYEFDQMRLCFLRKFSDCRHPCSQGT